MSRSGYSDNCANVAMWRGVVASAVRGKRGQRFFRALVDALDAMPVKRLIDGSLETAEGDVCALGSLARHKGVELKPDDTYRYGVLGEAFDIARQLVSEVMYENDDGGPVTWPRVAETPEARWVRLRAWAWSQVRELAAESASPRTQEVG